MTVTRELTKKNQISCEFFRSDYLHAFSEEQVRHEFGNILEYTSSEHAWCMESQQVFLHSLGALL